MGTYTALAVAARRPVAGLLLHSPSPLKQVVMGHHGWWNLWLLAGPIALQLPSDLDSVTNAKNIHAPAIFLLAEKDEVVPSRYHKLVADAYAGEKRIIELHGAYHNDPIEVPALRDLNNALGWLLAKASSSPTP